MNAAAYAFVRFTDVEHLLPGIEAVRSLPGVAAWQAVEGHYHLAVTLTQSDDALSQSLRDLPGVKNVLFCPVEDERRGGFTPDPEQCNAWLTMEIDAGSRDALAAALLAMETPRVGALAFSGDCCVAAVTGPGFESIDAAVERDIRPLDGVLRAKRDWIIDLTQL
ncbi:MAG: hypothetical protein KFH87_02355 [Bacteroidetes bacterium]|nr:hypothetical protein [Bacteroidota bacterium]